jgi:hypothetical protein
MQRVARPDTSAMEEEQPAKIGDHGSAAAGLILAYWLADGYIIGLPVAALAATWNPLIVFLAGVAVVISINLVACRFINTAWSSWANGSSGARIERQLDKVRPTRLGMTATRWISSNSDARFAAAAAFTCAIVAVTLGRSVGGRPLSPHRIRLAAVSYALFSIGLFTVAGVVAGTTLRLL